MGVTLVLFGKDGDRRNFPLKQGATSIGRKNDCDIRIPSPEVSRLHAEIITDEDGATVRDLGASNGTFLNHQRVTEEDFEPGDVLSIGPVSFAVQIDGEPTDEEIEAMKPQLLVKRHATKTGPVISTSEHVDASDEEIDPIAALEALASSADQTAIESEDEEKS